MQKICHNLSIDDAKVVCNEQQANVCDSICVKD